MRRYIAEGLEKYLNTEHHPWHMPGHKRIPGSGKNITDMLEQIMHFDVTEVPELDDLHHPNGMIRDSLEELRHVYGTCGSYYLINGSTCGIMTAITACCRGRGNGSHSPQGHDIIVAGNCHKSVYHTVELLGLSPVLVQPRRLTEDIYGAVCPEDVDVLCRENPGVRAVIITSPTYEGIVSDVAGIKNVLKRYDIPLIVDEAHGAHFCFIPEMPASAVTAKADIVIQSLHKTLPALTQTAVLHVTNERYREAVCKYLSYYMSSSPSFPMLSSMEYAVAWSQERDYGDYLACLKRFRSEVRQLRHIRLLGMEEAEKAGAYDYDISRLVLIAEEPMSGLNLEKALDETGKIVCEMSGLHHVVLISTMMDSAEEFEHLYRTLAEIDIHFEEKVQTYICVQGEAAALLGQTAKRHIYVYPPGIPIVMEGELVTEEKLSVISQYIKEGKRVYGL